MIDFGFSGSKLIQKGLEHRIENNGANLSQGERQLIALMKVLYTEKRVILLDEATSALDYATEKKLMDFLYERIRGRTLVTVAHRLNSVLGCDRIVVMHDGEIVETGSTQDLLNDTFSRFHELYQKMVQNIV